jgi:hypothetical protein
MWRYRDARSWRAPLVDAGHAIMAFRTVSAALGYSSYTYQKMRDEAVCMLLGISRFRQTPLFVGTII